MTNVLPLPTRRDESWRYGDLKALEAVWGELPQGPEQIIVPAGEKQTRQIIQPVPIGGVSVTHLDVRLEENAEMALHLLAADNDYGRIHIEVTLGKGAHFELGGAIIGTGDQTLEIVTEVTHAEPEATSNQVVRSVLGGKATGSFLGKVNVARNAQRTDAEQSVKAMLLDRTATANAKPELEIFADDVQCAHGATVGELDKQALFYMASRGIEPVTAQRLMLQAFIADAYVSVEDDAAREAIEGRALEALEAIL
ncbi:SufD family Fe-S cluster assembly protein [Alterisphingorhabdus coralli]|uniref:SufD family Fe-S cluster assembly protein n=1 Tax=Alterisphingorhabdus coralli TaxID=3071408 RepID=A0AA97F7F6_9SPHN|nr:SufD family Fe-S cluster assembly protein [Parasphingorhabdus sp. SCSIO 66989]WOE75316.1 SufD family Fe-S cluster assembly protein [Parasphingorhabdus sp. SCSIO 66989]